MVIKHARVFVNTKILLIYLREPNYVEIYTAIPSCEVISFMPAMATCWLHLHKLKLEKKWPVQNIVVNPMTRSNLN